jgi:hypothetical protein
MYSLNGIAPPAAAMAAVISSAAEGTSDARNIAEVHCNTRQHTKHQSGYTGNAKCEGK